MQTVSATLEAAGVSGILTLAPGRSAAYAATESSFVGIGYFERSRNGGASWEAIETVVDTSMAGGTVTNETSGDEWYRFRAIDTDGETPVSGSLVCTVADEAETLFEYRDRDGVSVLVLTEAGLTTAKRVSQKIIVNAAGQAKVGGTAGFVVAAAANVALVTCPASQTAAKLVVPVPAMKVGSTITGFHLVGQIESAGGAVTVDADLRKHTAAADVSDASVGAIAQLSVTADAIMSASNTRKADLAEVVAADETFYVLVTVTTAGSTDVALQGVAIEFSEA